MNEENDYVITKLHEALDLMEQKNDTLRKEGRFWEQEYRECQRGALFPWMLLFCCFVIGLAIGWWFM